ncbi:hypothetical protein MTO96_028729 [Rhipicephalus appendiculatus]
MKEGDEVTPATKLSIRPQLCELGPDDINRCCAGIAPSNHEYKSPRIHCIKRCRRRGAFFPMRSRGWCQGLLAATQRKYGVFLAVVAVTSLAAATLFAFAGMAQQTEDAEESMDVIRKAFEENMHDEQNAPSKLSASPNLNLLCRVPNRAGPDSPHDKDVLYSYDPAAFKKFLHLRDLAADVRLLLSVDLDAMLRTGWSPKRLASDARVWLDRSGVDGLHLDGLDILPRSIRNVSEIVTALRASFKRQYLLTIGIDRTQKIVEDELLKLIKLVDFASFSTSHIRHTDERTTLSNPYTKYENSTSGQFLSREVGQLAKLAARSPKSQVCFTLVLGGNQFQLRDPSEHGLGAPAKHVKDVSYSEICKRQWSEVKYIEPAIGFYARSGKTWVGYDTEKTIAAKVQLALRKYPDFCVMLVQVDKDDVRGICSERHFPLVQSVRHAMRHYHRQAPDLES